MDPNTAMEAATEGAKALTKFQEIIQKMFNPHWTKKQADADEYADEKKLQTIRNNPDMDIVYINGVMNARKRTPEALAYRAEQRQLAESIRQERNIENVIGFASNEISQMDDSNVSDEPVDADWITRLFHIVKDISSEEMQFVWGKILAGEIKRPGSFSLKTLDIIRNITRQDAEEFQRVAPLVLQATNCQFIISSPDILSQFGITFASVLGLDECGLLNSSGTLSVNLLVTNHQADTTYNKELFIHVIGTDEEKVEIPLGIHTLTRAGCELIQILDYTANDAYCFAVAEEISKRNKTVKVSVHKINSIIENTINYQETPLKTFGVENGEP